MPPASDVQAPNRRLDSWKEIAAFFDRDERTVKRWEKERSLPVHRLPGGARARVFAFSEELSRWMHSMDAAVAEESVPPLPPASIAEPDPSPVSVMPVSISSTHLPAEIPSGAERFRLRSLVFLLCAFLLMLVGVLVIGQRRNRAEFSPTAKASSLTPATSRHVVDPEVQQLYLKGRYYWTKRTPADLNKAVDFFTQAIVRDPSYAPAYVGMADCYNLLREYAAMPADEAYPRALAAARKAVELDDSSAEAHASLAFATFYWNWDTAGAEREFRRAIELNPNYAAAHHWYATFLMAIGRLPEALQQIARAQELDPASTPILADKALLLFQLGQADTATSLLKQIEASQPTFFSTHKYLGYIYLSKREFPAYLEEEMKAATLAHDQRDLAIVRAAERGYKTGGELEMLRDMLRVQKKFYEEGQLSAFFVADTAARLGQKEEALYYLQASYDRHDPIFLSIRQDPWLSSFHNDPHFRKLMAQSGLPPLP